ncbi:hypothetical protein D3C87_176130 [compost metagenome]
MDPFEEFEFKPLTDGLGFHKKKTPPAKQDVEVDSFASQDLLKGHGLELIEEGSVDPLRPPLPRKAKATGSDLTEVGGAGAPATAAVDEILKTLQKNRHLDFEKSKVAKRQMNTTKAEELKPAVWSFSSALLDTMLVVAATLLCMIILLVITRVDLIGNLTHPDDAGMIYLATFTLLAGVSFIYLLANRVFMGYTPGEWAFDQRIGKPEETNTAVYSLRVVARSLLVIATGFVLFPILSVLFGYDVAGAITGARLLKKV